MPSESRTLLIVGLGNVGVGICSAFARQGWRMIGVDINPALASLACLQAHGNLHLHVCAIDDLPDSELSNFLLACSEIVYAAECGNRDEYTSRPSLGQENTERFERFARRVVRLSQAGTAVHIAYVGGSWTRRGMIRTNGGRLEVTDDSPPKLETEANPYELAKTAAHVAAARLVAELGCSSSMSGTVASLQITFYDWASVVPNLAPNFSVAKMAVAALEGEPICYSAGDYGRPLLSACDAGRALLLVTEARLRALANGSVDAAAPDGCDCILLPGVFVPFERFAQLVQAVVATETTLKADLAVAEGDTPAFLAARCDGSRARLARLGFEPDAAAVEEGLRETAREFLRSRERT